MKPKCSVCKFMFGPLDGKRMTMTAGERPEIIEFVQPSGCLAVYQWRHTHFVFERFEVAETEVLG